MSFALRYFNCEKFEFLKCNLTNSFQVTLNWELCDPTSNEDVSNVRANLDEFWNVTSFEENGRGSWYGMDKGADISRLWISVARGDRWTVMSEKILVVAQDGDGTMPKSGKWWLYKDCYDVTEERVCVDVTIGWYLFSLMCSAGSTLP